MSYGRLRIGVEVLRRVFDLPPDFRLVSVKGQMLELELEIMVESPAIPLQLPMPEVIPIFTTIEAGKAKWDRLQIVTE